MNAVPFMENPKIGDILKYRESIPCFDKIENIIAEEIEMGNVILHIGDAGFSPSETVVVIDFATEPVEDYLGVKTGKLKDGLEYKYLTFSDNKGALTIDFGRMKGKE